MLLLLNLCLFQYDLCSQPTAGKGAFNTDSIHATMDRINDYFLDHQWQRVDRNWIRATYYTGLMTFYELTQNPKLLDQSRNWAAKHGWRTGTEWTFPANRIACVQTYLALYLLEGGDQKIENAREVMNNKISNREPAKEQGWDYVDALYVGTPAYMMMTRACGDSSYASYGHRMFRDVYHDLFDPTHHLFYRDEKAKDETTTGGHKVFWSRGNGWAIASLPRILSNLREDDPYRAFYVALLQQMAASLRQCQGSDGFWRVNLADSGDYPAPESSGTAFFTYAMAWGINQGYLDGDVYLPVVEKAWEALYSQVSPEGKVLWGQGVARGPGSVSREDSHEYVSGAFLLAGSEMIELLQTIKLPMD